LQMELSMKLYFLSPSAMILHISDRKIYIF